MKKRPPGLVHWKTSLGVEYLKRRVKWKRIDWIQPNPPPLKAEIWKLFYLMQFFIRGPLVPYGNPLFHEVLCIFQNKNFASIKFSSYLQKPIEICCCIGSVFFFSSFCNFFLKNGPIPASFSFIFGLFKQTSLQFLQQIYVKMSIQYMVPGFKPTTFGMWVPSPNH